MKTPFVSIIVFFSTFLTSCTPQMQANLQRAALAGIAQGLQPRGCPQQRGYPQRVMSPQMGYSSQGYPVGYMPQGGYPQMMSGGYGRDHGFTLYPRR